MSLLEPNLAAKVMMDDLRVKWQQARKALADAKQREDENHKEFQRLYHILERLPPFNAYEGYQIAKRMQEVLVARRQAKWDADAWAMVVEFTDYSQTKMLAVAQKVDWKAHGCERYVKEGPPEDARKEEAHVAATAAR